MSPDLSQRLTKYFYSRGMKRKGSRYRNELLSALEKYENWADLPLELQLELESLLTTTGEA